MIKTCARCYGLYVTNNFEAFAGKPCTCEAPAEHWHDQNTTITALPVPAAIHRAEPPAERCLVTCHNYVPRGCAKAHRCELQQGHALPHRYETHGFQRTTSEDAASGTDAAYLAHLKQCRECRTALCEEGRRLWESNGRRPAYIAREDIGSEASGTGAAPERLWIQTLWLSTSYPAVAVICDKPTVGSVEYIEKSVANAQVARLRDALRVAANELEHLYAFAITHGIPEAATPPHTAARAVMDSAGKE